MTQKLFVSFSALAKEIKNGISLEELDQSLFAMFYTERESSVGEGGKSHYQRKMGLKPDATFIILENTLLLAESEGRAIWLDPKGDNVAQLSHFLVGRGLNPLNHSKWPERIDNYVTFEDRIHETNPVLEVVWQLR